MAHLNIRQERIDREWTQEYVGSNVGVTKTCIHDIETGKQKPSYDLLVKLETLFGLSHRYLLAQVGEAEQQDSTTQPLEGVGIAKELESAHRNFKLDVVAIADIIEDGRLDCPEKREHAQKLYDMLGDVLRKPAA